MTGHTPPGYRYGFPVRRDLTITMNTRVIYDESEVAEGETLHASMKEAMDSIMPKRRGILSGHAPVFLRGKTVDPAPEGQEPIGYVLESWSSTGAPRPYPRGRSRVKTIPGTGK